MTETELILACRKQNRRAQQRLYDAYSPVLFGVCKRYISRKEDAEDILVEAFFKIFSNLDQYKGEGSFEGWMRRIVANEALMFLRRRNLFQFDIEMTDLEIAAPSPIHSDLAAQDIMNLLDQLPTGYRTVFNLYALEGFKHREIADMLGISINTSKSQLALAKKKLQGLLGMDYEEEMVFSEQNDQEEI